MEHEHVQIAVADSDPPGVEHVPAVRIDDDKWELIRSPLYALGVCSGDVIRVLNEQSGSVEVLKRGGNLSVQFYLPDSGVDDADATAHVAQQVAAQIESFGGRVDALTPGLIVSTIPLGAGFQQIERTFAELVGRYPGAQWQYGNVDDPITGEPLDWWK